ncbi:hypothetical protein LCGC14_0662180 [marine sediment metagenome]|uniref:2-hydroxyacyl-CoA dehydratase n=1 Tax=marine sediment metagenome TaxID=412755 RepID=A0A0F9RDD5_9ZZZZ
MSVYNDVINFTSVLKISYNFLMGRRELNQKRSKERKKLISVASGFPDLVFAADSIPVFPIRMEKFKMNLFLVALNSATNLFGWDLTTQLLGIVKQLDFLKIVDNTLNNVIDSINEKYNLLYNLAVDNKVSEAFCFGVKSIYGMHVSKSISFDSSINFTIRCNKYNNYIKSLRTTNPNQIWVDIPHPKVENHDNLELMTNNIKNAISELENITGNVVTDNSLKKQFRIGNQVKRYYKTIIYDISTSDYYPCNPATFAEILALLTITFQDYNSNGQRYLENMSQLVKEMKERMNKGVGMDVSHMPRILLTPIFNGWEPATHEIIFKLGGRVLYADWDLLGFLEEISVSKNSDPTEEYARFLLNAFNKGIMCLENVESLTNSYINYIKKIKVDGLIVNQLIGCHFHDKRYDYMKNKIRTELRLPTIGISFKMIGENLEQIKSKLDPFMEQFI